MRSSLYNNANTKSVNFRLTNSEGKPIYAVQQIFAIRNRTSYQYEKDAEQAAVAFI